MTTYRGVKTHRQQLIEQRLGQDLEQWVAAGRADGLSWKALAHQLRRITGQPLTRQGLHLWYGPNPKRGGLA